MSEINHKQLEFMLMNCYNTTQPLYIQGGIGIGKSVTVKRFVKKITEKKGLEFVAWNDSTKDKKAEIMANPAKYLSFVDLRALMLDLGDFKLPLLTSDKKNGFEWSIPMMFSYLCTPGANAILFLDEFNLAPPIIQGMFYSIVNDRQVGEHRLADGVYVVAAGNREEDKAATYTMPMPLRNRFMHVTLGKPSVEDWAAWAVENEIDARVISYLLFREAMLYKPPENGRGKTEYAFATPRTWEKCSIGIAGLTSYDQIKMIADASVGEVAAIELLAHIKMAAKTDLNKLLDAPDEVLKITEPQMLLAVASGLVEKYRTDKKRLGKIVAVGDRMKPEYTLWMLQMIKGIAENSFGAQINAATDIKKFVDRYGKYLLDS